MLWVVAVGGASLLNSATAKFHYSEYKTVDQMRAGRDDSDSPLMNLW